MGIQRGYSYFALFYNPIVPFSQENFSMPYTLQPKQLHKTF